MIYQEKRKEAQAEMFDGSFESVKRIMELTKLPVTLDLHHFDLPLLTISKAQGAGDNKNDLKVHLNEFVVKTPFDDFDTADAGKFLSIWEPKEDSDA